MCIRDSIDGVEKMSHSKLISCDPVLSCCYLQNKFDAILEFIVTSETHPLGGKVVHHFVRTEYQTRLLPHFHCFFWIEGAPIIGVDSEQVVLDFISTNVSCKLPTASEDQVGHDLVKRFQAHKCNAYCKRNNKCKFSFPRPVRVKPVLHDVCLLYTSPSPRD